MINEKWSPPRHQEGKSQEHADLSFIRNDPILKHCSGDDPLIIKAKIRGCVIHHVYVDGKSSAEIMYEHCFQQLDDETKASLRLPMSPLVGFSRQVLWPLGVITAPFTFFDYIGKGSLFPEAPGRVKVLVVIIDYFTKWVEAVPLATITGKNILKFVWNNIVWRFGIPSVIISDNGKQFKENPFRD
ncbi:reverse transcriptase domain-containing protein, partial [Tanacetum coccineum]